MNVPGRTSATTARVDWFARTEKKHFDRTANADRIYSFDAPVDASIEQLLALGYALGIHKGSQRAGCFEIQTSLGIWTSPRGRMNPKTAHFASWEQLEAEDAGRTSAGAKAEVSQDDQLNVAPTTPRRTP